MKHNEYTVYTFTKVNAEKKYQSFTVYDIDKLEDARLYMEKGMVIRHEGTYYQYKGQQSYHAAEPTASRIHITIGPKVIHVLPI